jgi:glycerophosphoryl diester phosphodiesterase
VGQHLWRIAEQLVVAKTGNPAECEDIVVVTEAFAAVIDGATSKTVRRWNGRSGGRAAAELIAEAIPQLPAGVTARAAIDLLSAQIARFYHEHGVAELVRTNPVERVTAACMIFSVARAECWLVGDCQCLVGEQHVTNELPVDAVTSLARALFLESELLRGVTLDELRAHDTARDVIAPLLARQAHFQNNPAAGAFGYAALDGFPVADSGIVVVPVPAPVTSLVLASDGYPFLLPSLAEAEQRLHTLLAADPLLFRVYRSTKGFLHGQTSFDDRAYLRLERVGGQK